MINYDKLSKFNGLAAVGDIHGNIEDMQKAVAFCQSHNYFILSLGDLTDYGHENYECVKLLHSIIQSGDGAMIIGNHDDKMKRYLVQRKAGQIFVKLKGGLLTTIAEIDALSSDEYDDFEKKFLEIYVGAKYREVLGNVIFAHAAVHPDMWTQSEFGGKLKSRALYGQIDRDMPEREDGFPNRIYDWVHVLDAGQIAVVGHDVQSKKWPVIKSNSAGGQAMFVDTGSSKGGKLSLVPFEITFNGGLVLKPLDFVTF